MRDISIVSAVFVSLLACQVGFAQEIRSLPALDAPIKKQSGPVPGELYSVVELPKLQSNGPAATASPPDRDKIVRLASLPGFEAKPNANVAQVIELDPIEQLPADAFGEAPGPVESFIDQPPPAPLSKGAQSGCRPD